MMIQLKVSLSYTASGEHCDDLLDDLEIAAGQNEGVLLRIGSNYYEVEVTGVKEVPA